MKFSDLAGCLITAVEVDEDRSIIFRTRGRGSFLMYHAQECCEWVWLEDVTGDLQSLIGGVVVSAEEVIKEGDVDYGDQYWTFYHIRTARGDVTLRWCGESNGYYSTSVDFVELNDDDRPLRGW